MCKIKNYIPYIGILQFLILQLNTIKTKLCRTSNGCYTVCLVQKAPHLQMKNLA